MSALSGLSFGAAMENRSFWERLTESAVGAHVVNGLAGSNMDVLYWRDANLEVDFVVSDGSTLAGIEVKSGRVGDTTRGMAEFEKRFSPDRLLLVGHQGIQIGDFLSTPAPAWI